MIQVGWTACPPVAMHAVGSSELPPKWRDWVAATNAARERVSPAGPEGEHSQTRARARFQPQKRRIPRHTQTRSSKGVACKTDCSEVVVVDLDAAVVLLKVDRMRDTTGCLSAAAGRLRATPRDGSLLLLCGPPARALRPGHRRRLRVGGRAGGGGARADRIGRSPDGGGR